LLTRRFLALLGAALLLSSCAPQPAADQSAAAISAIRAADAAWLKVFAARDTNATVAAVEATGSVLAPNAPIATGPDAIRALFAGFYSLPGLTIHWEAADVQAARSGELGYSRGAYELGFTDPKGKPVVEHGKYATVWRKQTDGTWKVVLDIFNSDMPAGGM
jgi:ketosteroid isomerase-like protein